MFKRHLNLPGNTQRLALILLSFAAENRKSYCSGCMKVANVLWQYSFLDFGADDFPFKILVQTASIFFRFGAEISVLELQFLMLLRVLLLCLATQFLQ